MGLSAGKDILEKRKFSFRRGFEYLKVYAVTFFFVPTNAEP